MRKLLNLLAHIKRLFRIASSLCWWSIFYRWERQFIQVDFIIYFLPKIVTHITLHDHWKMISIPIIRPWHQSQNHSIHIILSLILLANYRSRHSQQLLYRLQNHNAMRMIITQQSSLFFLIKFNLFLSIFLDETFMTYLISCLLVVFFSVSWDIIDDVEKVVHAFKATPVVVWISNWGAFQFFNFFSNANVVNHE